MVSFMKMDKDEVFSWIYVVGNILSPLYLYDPLDHKTDDLFAHLRAQESEELAYLFAPDDSQSDKQVEELVSNFKASLDTQVEELSQDYRRMFVGPAHKLVPLWGSVYLDHDGVIFGTSTLELRAWMREKGIAQNVDDRLPEDHLGKMFALMAWLARNKAHDLQAFLEIHFLPWAYHVLDLITMHAQTEYYVNLSKLSTTVLRSIENYLNLEVTKRRLFR
ncbi:MAG: Tat proofreading chaperone DmsD [Coriobacteriia bacterium]|nr:Tat proofreading chaperone DmsD [Coriobacteriia bacterium]